MLQLSALSGQGVDSLWSAAQEFRELRQHSGAWDARRRRQALAWMWERIEAGLRQAFRSDTRVSARLDTLSREVADGTVVASAAARELLGVFRAAADVPPQEKSLARKGRSS